MVQFFMEIVVHLGFAVCRCKKNRSGNFRSPIFNFKSVSIFQVTKNAPFKSDTSYHITKEPFFAWEHENVKTEVQNWLARFSVFLRLAEKSNSSNLRANCH